MFTLNPVHTARHVTCTAAVAALVLAVLAMPASAGTTQISGVAVFNNECQPTGGSPPDDLGDYPPIDLSGSLDGCWYTYVSASQVQPERHVYRAGNRDLRRLHGHEVRNI